MKGYWILLTLLLLASARPALAETNLIRNGRFEHHAQRPGEPDDWKATGDVRFVTQTLMLDAGREGRQSAKLNCTRLEGGGPAVHAMLYQMGIPIVRGKNYRLSFWARGENITNEMISVGLPDTKTWSPSGLEDGFAVASEWRRCEAIFRATRDGGPHTRFQIWFTSTGTLWIDDVVLEATDESVYRPGHIHAAAGHRNLVPNASFECGVDGWGSADADRSSHWGTPMNDLFGQVDPQEKFDGQSSLRIDLALETAPVAWFDYYELTRRPVLAPLAASQGFMEVEPGRSYVFSVYLKARADGTPARLAVREFQGRTTEKLVRVSTQWQRYSLTLKPSARWCYVLAGPDLRKTAENPRPPDCATLWLDALQLEQADQPGPFVRRAEVEWGLATDRPGNVFGLNDPLAIRVTVANSDPQWERTARIDLRLTDFFDRNVWEGSVSAHLPPGQSLPWTVPIQPAPALRGFLRLHAVAKADEALGLRTMRLAAIPAYTLPDSRFGVNHAYPWPHLLDLTHKAGMTWFRDWSLKWQEVEPEKGRFTFAEADLQIDRPRAAGFQVLGMLPFPSSKWASTAPAGVGMSDRYPENRARVAYAPRDLGEFENYVQQTVAHYRGRIAWWQVFNEPIYTSYALPRKLGYDGATYAGLVQAFVRAARRADPQCRVLAGIGGLSAGDLMQDFEKFFAAGGLQGVDAVDIHHYPRLRSPEYIEELLTSLGSLMEKHGGRKPIWLTEFGYYGEDEPATIPILHQNFDRPLDSEQTQAAYVVRWSVIMLANGVDRLFYHAGTSTGINSDHLEGTFYEFAGQPRKLYAAQATMAQFFTPTCRFVKRLSLGEGTRGYLFRDDKRLTVAAWTVGSVKPREIRLTDTRLQASDLMGRSMEGRELTLTGVPVYLTAEGLSGEQFERGVEAGGE